MEINGKIGSCITNEKGEFVKIDHNCAGILGYTPKELLGKNISTILFKEDLELMKGLHDKYLTEEVTPAIRRYKKKNGDSIFAQTSGIGFESSEDGLYKFTTIKDMTDIMRIEREMGDYVSKLEEAQHLGNIGYWSYDKLKDEITWSKQMFEIFERDKNLGPPKLERAKMYFGRDQEKMNNARDMGLSHSEPYEFDVELYTEKGNHKYLHIIGKPEGELGGPSNKILGVVQDITERVKDQQALQESELRLQSAIDGANLGIWDWDFETGENVINDRWLTMLGYPADFGKVDLDFFMSLVHPDDHIKIESEFERLNTTDSDSYDNVLRLKHKDGEYRYIRDTGRVLEYNIEGKVKRMIGTHLDITEQVKNEEANKESQLRYQVALDGANLGMWDLNIETGVNIVNDRWFEMLGYEGMGNESSLEFFNSLLHPEDVNIPFNELELINKKEKTEFHVDIRLRHKDGRYRIVRSLGRAIEFDENGIATRMIGSHMDITDQVLNQRALEESKIRYQAAINGADLGVWDLNLKTGENYINDRWLTMLGYSEMAPGMSTFEFFNSIVHPADQDKIAGEIQRLNEGGENNIDIIVRLRHKNGKYRTILDRGTVIKYDEDGNVERMIGTHLDITEEVLSREGMLQAREESERAIEGGNIGLWEFDLEQDSIDGNEKYFSMLGFDKKDIEDQWQFVANHIHPEDLPIIASERNKVMDQLSTDFDIVLRIKNSHNQYQFIRSQGQVNEWDSDGKPTKIAGSHVDISNQKTVENELIESEKRYRFLAESLPHILWTAKPDGGLNFINQYGSDYLNASQNDILDWNWTAFLHSEQIDQVVSKFKNCIEQKIPFENLQMLRNAEGEYEWFKVTAYPQLDLAGHVKSWIGLSTNIHAEILAEQEAKDQQRLLAEVTANFPHNYLSVIDNDMRVKFSGGEEFKTLGLDPSAFNGVLVEDVFKDYNQPEELETILSAYRMTFKGEPQKFEIHLGDQIQLYKTQPLRNYKGEIDMILTVVENVTEQRENLKKLEKTIQIMTEVQSLTKTGDYEFDVETFTPIRWSPIMWEVFDADIEKGMYTAEEIAGLNFGNTQAYFEENLNKAIEESIPCAMDLELITYSGKEKFIHMSIIPEGKPGEKAKTLRGVMHDLTERKKIENEKLKQQDLTRAIVDNVPNAYVTVLDKDLVIKYTGGQEFENQGFDSQSFIGMTLLESMGHFGSEVINSLTRLYKDTLKGNPGSVKHTFDDFHLEYKTAPLRNANGEIDSILVVTENITQSVLDKEMIERSLDEKEILLQEVHHRVKNNLAIVASLFYLEQVNSDNEEVHKILADSQTRIKSIAEVHELLYKNESFTDVSLEDYVNDIVDYLKTNFFTKNKDIQTHVDIDPVRLGIDKAIPVALLVNELLINAFKHAFVDRDYGTLWIMAKDQGRDLSLTIKDDGVGLPDDFNFDEPISLGMKLIHEFSNQIEGDVSWDWQKDKGTVFRIKIQKDIHGI